jgi:hypothetical protein
VVDSHFKTRKAENAKHFPVPSRNASAYWIEYDKTKEQWMTSAHKSTTFQVGAMIF